MSKILILAQSGFGKSSSYGNIPELGIEGLNPEDTYLITTTSKPLPFRGSKQVFPKTDINNLKGGKRLVSNNADEIAATISTLAQAPPIKNIIFDDANYVMQDYYMANALKTGYDVFKKIGSMMDKIFNAAEQVREDQNFIMLAHHEEYKDASSDNISYRMKTVGSMVSQYITPEGKFEVVLFGRQAYNQMEKKALKEFVTNFDGQFPAKSPVGMFDELYIPNDLGIVIKKVDEYYNS